MSDKEMPLNVKWYEVDDAQKQIRERIKKVKEKRQAIGDVVKCPECGVFIPMQAGSCGACTNCGNQIGGC